MRLIDADKAYEILTDYYHQKTYIQHLALKEALDRVPTIERPEIVRCKDCTYRGEINCPMYYKRAELTDDDFCSFGEVTE